MTSPDTLRDFVDYLTSGGYSLSTAVAYRGGVLRILNALPHPDAVQDREALQAAMQAAHVGLGPASVLHAQGGWKVYARYRGLPNPWESEAPSVEWLTLVAALRRCGATWDQIAGTTWGHVEVGARYCKIRPPGLRSADDVTAPVEVFNVLALAAAPSGEIRSEWQLCCVGKPPVPSPARLIARTFRDHMGSLPLQT